jgi:hypothetical protein
MRRAIRNRTARLTVVLGVAVTGAALSAVPAHAMEWERGQRSPHVIDCRTGACYNSDGTLNDHETVCHNAGWMCGYPDKPIEID